MIAARKRKMVDQIPPWCLFYKITCIESQQEDVLEGVLLVDEGGIVAEGFPTDYYYDELFELGLEKIFAVSHFDFLPFLCFVDLKDVCPRL